MTKPVPTALANDLAAGVSTLCRLWRLKPKTKDTMRFTDHDYDVILPEGRFKSSRSLEASAINNVVNSLATNLEVTAALGEDITYLDVLRKVYQGASVEIVLVNYEALGHGEMVLFSGVVGATMCPSKLQAVFSCRSGNELANKPLTERFTPGCRADFGDSRCGFNLDTVRANMTVTSVTASGTGPTAFFTQLTNPNNHWNGGKIQWLTGPNAGAVQEVAVSQANGLVRLFLPPPHAPLVGNTAYIWRGCPKTVDACRAYGNILNYRGEPYVPGDDFNVKQGTR